MYFLSGLSENIISEYKYFKTKLHCFRVVYSSKGKLQNAKSGVLDQLPY